MKKYEYKGMCIVKLCGFKFELVDRYYMIVSSTYNYE